MTQDQSIERSCPAQDIISELPDMIRLYILTFLPRKYAARTCVLSSKWKDLWANRFPYPTTFIFGRATDNIEDQKELANEIQEHMTQHGDKKIETYNLYFYPGKTHEEMAAKWVEQAIKNGVEEFRLDFSQGSMGQYPRKQLARRAKKFELKESLFKCNSALTSLTLIYCRLQRYFKFRYFSCLEVLCLRQVNINDFMLEKLIVNCHMLESLELRQCVCLKHIRVPATLSRLKKLIVVHCCMAKEINISAPRLHIFHFFGNYPHIFVMVDSMPFLNDVILMAPTKDPWLMRSTPKLAAIGLARVQVLTLCGLGLSLISGPRNTPCVPFEYIKELQLLMNIYSEFNYIYKYFKGCHLPHLERLFIELPNSCWDYVRRDNSPKLQDLPSMTFDKLNVIKIDNFKGILKELLLLEFLLRSAINLERIILVFSHEFYMGTNWNERQDFFNDIMLRPRASARAEVVMLYTYEDDYSFRAVHFNEILDFQHLQAEIFLDRA